MPQLLKKKYAQNTCAKSCLPTAVNLKLQKKNECKPNKFVKQC